MNYKGRVAIVIIYVSIVLGWHGFYFLYDYESAYVFMIEQGSFKWDFLFIPLLSPFFWWLGLQYDKAKFLSEKDVLTNLYNRRFVSQITPKLLLQAEKTEQELTVFVIDCNHFKCINDRFGHEAGDLALKEIARLLQSHTTKRGIAARWGGDEFLILSPDTDSRQAAEKIKRIEAGLLSLSENMGMELSVSIGMASYPKEAVSIKELLIIADRHMYDAKKRRKETVAPLTVSPSGA